MARRPFWGALGLALIISGAGVIVLLRLAGVGVPFEDRALDQRAAMARGTVTAVERHPRRTEVLVSFRFKAPVTLGRDTIESASFTTDEPPSVGSEQPIEFLPDDPRVARIAGMRRTLRAFWMRVATGAVVLPGVLMVLFWLRLMVRDKLLLSVGNAAPIAIERIDGTANLHVHYGFDTEDGRRLTGNERVPAPSLLGQQVRDGSTIWVLYDASRPNACMLVQPEWFASNQRISPT